MKKLIKQIRAIIICLLITLGMVNVIFISCKEKIEPEPEPITVRSEYSSVDHFRNGVSAINSANNKDNYIIDTKDFAADRDTKQKRSRTP